MTPEELVRYNGLMRKLATGDNPLWVHSKARFPVKSERTRPYRWREVMPNDVLVDVDDSTRWLVTAVTRNQADVKVHMRESVVDSRNATLKVKDGARNAVEVDGGMPIGGYALVRYGWEHEWACVIKGALRSVRLDHRGVVTIYDDLGRQYRLDPMVSGPWNLDEILRLLNHLHLIRL